MHAYVEFVNDNGKIAKIETEYVFYEQSRACSQSAFVKIPIAANSYGYCI